MPLVVIYAIHWSESSCRGPGPRTPSMGAVTCQFCALEVQDAIDERTPIPDEETRTFRVPHPDDVEPPPFLDL